jgi:hypothetical protein
MNQDTDIRDLCINLACRTEMARAQRFSDEANFRHKDSCCTLFIATLKASWYIAICRRLWYRALLVGQEERVCFAIAG